MFSIVPNLDKIEINLENKKDLIECKGISALKVKELLMHSSTDPFNNKDGCNNFLENQKVKNLILMPAELNSIEKKCGINLLEALKK